MTFSILYFAGVTALVGLVLFEHVSGVLHPAPSSEAPGPDSTATRTRPRRVR